MNEPLYTLTADEKALLNAIEQQIAALKAQGLAVLQAILLAHQIQGSIRYEDGKVLRSNG